MSATRVAALVSGLLALSLVAAAPLPPRTSFPAAAVEKLDNGVAIVSQSSAGAQIIGAQVFLQAGLMQQAPDKAGIAGIAASIVMQTPVEGKQTLGSIASDVGASVSYTLDPTDTRFYIEARASDFPRLLHDLRSALRSPALSQLASEQSKAVTSANAATKSPLQAAYAMVRRVRYAGTGFAFPDQGNALSIANLSTSDMQQYFRGVQRASGTVIAMTGAVNADALAAAKREFSDFSAGPAQPLPLANRVDRSRQIVAHRDVASPWIAVGYPAPNQYSNDFASMLVIEALLGYGGDVHALAFTSNSTTPLQYLGAFYQYEATPGSLVVFLDGSGTNVDQAVRDLETGVARLRSQSLPAPLIDEAKQVALGNFYLSSGDLNQLAWQLGRSSQSPEGVQFENLLPQRIARVSAADVKRAAQRYLTKETVAIILPQAGR